MCRAQAGIGSPLVVSLLGLEKALKDEFAASFSIILDILTTVMEKVSRTTQSLHHIWDFAGSPMRIPPAGAASLLLDTLLLSVQERLSMVDMVTSSALTRVFATTAEPIWGMVMKWLIDGMPVRDGGYGQADTKGLWRLDNEFCIEDNEFGLVDPDFWEEGFTLREGSDGEVEKRSSYTPLFLEHVARYILGSGKATGLLRAMGISPTADIERGAELMKRTFTQLLLSHTESTSLSVDTLSSLVYAELLPYCQATDKLLRTVLVEDCSLWQHLIALEGLYLMRRGDSMSHLTDVLFAKVRSLDCVCS